MTNIKLMKMEDDDDMSSSSAYESESDDNQYSSSPEKQSSIRYSSRTDSNVSEPQETYHSESGHKSNNMLKQEDQHHGHHGHHGRPQLSELELLQRECASMVSSLKQLHEEETTLRKGNEILAQHAVLIGCTGGLDGGTKRARKRPVSGGGSGGKGGVASFTPGNAKKKKA